MVADRKRHLQARPNTGRYRHPILAGNISWPYVIHVCAAVDNGRFGSIPIITAPGSNRAAAWNCTPDWNGNHPTPPSSPCPNPRRSDPVLSTKSKTLKRKKENDRATPVGRPSHRSAGLTAIFAHYP